MENLHRNMRVVIFSLLCKHKNMQVFRYFLHLVPPSPPNYSIGATESTFIFVAFI